jgi:hypothetical protein
LSLRTRTFIAQLTKWNQHPNPLSPPKTFIGRTPPSEALPAPKFEWHIHAKKNGGPVNYFIFSIIYRVIGTVTAFPAPKLTLCAMER